MSISLNVQLLRAGLIPGVAPSTALQAVCAMTTSYTHQVLHPDLATADVPRLQIFPPKKGYGVVCMTSFHSYQSWVLSRVITRGDCPEHGRLSTDATMYFAHGEANGWLLQCSLLRQYRRHLQRQDLDQKWRPPATQNLQPTPMLTLSQERWRW